MGENLFRRRCERYYPQFLYDFALDMFSIVQYWESPVSGSARGRLFEEILCRYCDGRDLPLSERSGSRTVRGQRAASCFLHENDGVLATPDLTVHCELKHLSEELTKNELLVFNQKGLDYLLADNPGLRERPFYRVVLSGNLVKPEARRFALQWGILIIEPDRLPFIVLHDLAGRCIDGLLDVAREEQDEIWIEVPKLIVPLQERVRRFASLLTCNEQSLGDHRIDCAIGHLQRVAGDYLWTAMEHQDPGWLENRFDAINDELNLDGMARTFRQTRAISERPLLQ